MTVLPELSKSFFTFNSPLPLGNETHWKTQQAVLPSTGKQQKLHLVCYESHK